MADHRAADAADSTDKLSDARTTVGQAITALQGFTGSAGSPEMRAVTAAIQWLGYAYSALRDPPEDNPAWTC